MIVTIINALISIVEAIANMFLSLLPNSPFQVSYSLPDWVTWVGVFIPIQTLIGIMITYVGCVAAYYVVRVALRWAKVVGQ